MPERPALVVALPPLLPWRLRAQAWARDAVWLWRVRAAQRLCPCPCWDDED